MHIATSLDNTPDSAFVQMLGVNAISWRVGTGYGGLRFGSASDLLLGNYQPGILFTDGGAIAIGTTQPFDYKLAVNGSAIFTKAVVKLN